MRRWCLGRSRWIISLLALLAGFGLAFSVVGRLEADEPMAWGALGPAERQISRLFTPTSGALVAESKGELLRSDDGGLTWVAVPRPPDVDVITVSPTNHDLLYAAGQGGVFRSEDGGGDWRRMSDHAGTWANIEVSPADPATLYGVVITSPPVDYGTNRWHEFLVSHDSGASWEVARVHRERILPGTQPCSYTVRTLQPHALDPGRVVTIEGCTGRGMDPISGQSPDEGRDVVLFPDLRPEVWAASATVGGRGIDPDRWYVALYRPGIPYTRIHHSKVLRSDDDGRSWTPLLESNSGEPTRDTAKPVDFVTALAYNPDRPEELYAITARLEPQVQSSGSVEYRTLSIGARASRDGGTTWSDLGAADLPPVADLAVGIDGRYLFAATDKGIYRIALSQ